MPPSISVSGVEEILEGTPPRRDLQHNTRCPGEPRVRSRCVSISRDSPRAATPSDQKRRAPQIVL